jgi:endonuclease/exonuclease/phosphatase (EEP) superfamily protein YafD
MTFNIWGGSYRKKTAEVIRTNGLPDIVALQELRPFMIRLLLPLLGAYYPYHEFDLRGTGMGVFSRYPLLKIVPSFKLQPGWQLQVLQVQAEGRTFILYNCHPRSTDIFRGLSQGWAFASEVNATFHMRLQFAQNLLDDLKTRHAPVIMVGDFNSPDGSDVHLLLLTRLQDAHRRAGWGFGNTFPAHQGYSHGLPIFRKLTRIDMIFYSGEFIALSSHVGATSGESDHLPVLATLAWQQ